MPTEDFDAFVASLQSKKTETKRFWENEKNKFIEYVDGLYTNIEAFLQSHIKNGSVNLEYFDIEILEEDTGLYKSRKCLVTIGHRSVLFTPIGTQLIGMKGRVDVRGGFGRGLLVLVDATLKTFRLNVEIQVNGRSLQSQSPRVEAGNEPVDWVWRIVSPSPVMNFQELNQDNFLRLIMDVSNA